MSKIVGDTVFDGDVTVTGSLSADIEQERVWVTSGSAEQPAYSFQDDYTSGVYKDEEGLGIAYNKKRRLVVSDETVRIQEVPLLVDEIKTVYQPVITFRASSKFADLVENKWVDCAVWDDKALLSNGRETIKWVEGKVGDITEKFFYVQESGIYEVSYQLFWKPSSEGKRAAFIQFGTTEAGWGYDFQDAGRSSGLPLCCRGKHTASLKGGSRVSILARTTTPCGILGSIALDGFVFYTSVSFSKLG